MQPHFLILTCARTHGCQIRGCGDVRDCDRAFHICLDLDFFHHIGLLIFFSEIILLHCLFTHALN